MQRIAFLMQIKQGSQEQYIDAHAPDHVWPEILSACKEAGIRNYSIWLGGHEKRQAFGCFETDDYENTVRSLAANPANIGWQQHMARFMDKTGSFAKSEDMDLLRPAFYLP